MTEKPDNDYSVIEGGEDATIGQEPLTPEQMRELLAQERQARITAFNNELQVLLQKHNVRLEAEVLLTARGVIPMLKAYANEELQQ